MTFEPGELIQGRYELGRQLGAGGMARVYLAHDRLLDREVAVKVLSEPYASDPQFVERFRREASAAAGLNHPNIVAVYDRGEADGSYYIVMEYLRGPDLKQVVRRRAPLPPAEAIDATLQILAALGAAHRRDVIHRDVKPQNVLLAEDGHLKVTDFGIARAGAESDMTEAGSVIGTAQYLSPEQARGDEVTTASDTYAVGIVLYELLTGRVPFDGGPPVAVAMKQITDAPEPPRAIEPGIPPVLEDVVLRALAKRPSERYRTAQEMARALEAARAEIDGGTTRVLATGPPPGDMQTTRVSGPGAAPTRVGPAAAPRTTPPVPTERRRRWPIVAALLLLLAVAGAVGAFLLLGGGAETVRIPDVRGQEADAAQAELERLPVVVDRRTVTDDDITAGRAIGTDPGVGEEVEEGSTVTLRISGGPDTETVPPVEGQEEAAATAALERLGFDVVPVEEASGDLAAGLAIRTEPAAGQEAERDSQVRLFVSTGAEQVKVPNVRRLDVATAEQRLINAGFEVAIDNEQTGRFPPGTVIDQEPKGGRADRGSVVTITVAIAPANVTVPDVVGLPFDEANATLGAEGFQVISETAFADDPIGTVIDQEPDGDIQATPGSRVVITVSDGPDPGAGDGGDEGDEGAVPAPPPTTP